MAETLVLDTEFAPAYGQAVPVGADIARITVRNPSPFTFHGTNSYIVGRDTLAVIDPGPEDEAHYQALTQAIGGRPVSHIFVSHTHRDHSPLAARLKAATGAIVIAEGPHRAARPLHGAETNPLDASADHEFRPDVAAADGELVVGDGWEIRVVHTPGHAANHAVFALEGAGIVFSADHVMAWSTTIVAPPDGRMSDYMASLDKLMARDDALHLPGHGGAVRRPRAFMRALKTHRLMRENAIRERVVKGDRTIADMVKVIYRDTNPVLHRAAGLSVLAHLEDLVARGVVTTQGDVRIDGIYLPG
jgi:glyoxylase-like metal-dependent hydrolase (beta-lactamase superfamily II)